MEERNSLLGGAATRLKWEKKLFHTVETEVGKYRSQLAIRLSHGRSLAA